MKIVVATKVQEFVSSLESQSYVRVIKSIDLLEKYGYLLSFPQSRAFGNGLFELRVHGQSEIRLFYCYANDCAYILHAFLKKSQKTPTSEITKAKRIRKALNLR